MKERPILFSAPMVRALLADTKTQTRRVVKPQPPSWARHYWGAQGTYSGVAEPRHYWANFPTGEQAFEADADFDIWPGRDKSDQPSDEDIFGGGGFESPFGSEANCIKSAARLWVREAFRFTDVFDADSPSRVGERCIDAGYRTPWAPLQFEADGARVNWQHTGTPPHEGPPQPGKLRPAMFMPRWASRITLEVTGVRVERLQEISEADAVAEGIESRQVSDADTRWLRYDRDESEGKAYSTTGDARASYRSLWESINGPGSWAANPWVWVVEFTRIAAVR